MFLWTGFIQQIGERDLNLTLELAREIAKKEANAEFLFSFKPEFRSKAREYTGGHPRITILDAVDNFEHLLGSADFLLSPIENVESIVAPPLTWIESISSGTPVITTDAGGAREIIADGQNGFIGAGYGELVNTLSGICKMDSYSELRKKAHTFASEKYDINKCAENYIKLYKEMVNDNE